MTNSRFLGCAPLGACQGAQGAENPDLDAPLSTSEEIERSQSFSEAYSGWAFESEGVPIKSIVGRAWRELNGSARSVTVIPLKRFRPEADMQGQTHPNDGAIALGGGYTLKHSDDDSRLPGQELSNILIVLQCVRLMVYAWALCGACLADSKESVDTSSGKPRCASVT